jgi:hypothetical protein
MTPAQLSKFATERLGLKITEDDARVMVADWRNACPAIAAFYDQVEKDLERSEYERVYGRDSIDL